MWPHRSYDVLPDGRFVAIADANDVGARSSPRIRVVLNWFDELKAKVPTR